MQQIHLEGNTNKSDVNYLILDIGGTLCKVCVVEIQNKSKIYFTFNHSLDF